MSSATGAAGQARLPREVWSLIGANAVIALGYGVVAPVLPQLARHFGVSISAATFVITAFAVMRLLAAPPAQDAVAATVARFSWSENAADLARYYGTITAG